MSGAALSKRLPACKFLSFLQSRKTLGDSIPLGSPATTSARELPSQQDVRDANSRKNFPFSETFIRLAHPRAIGTTDRTAAGQFLRCNSDAEQEGCKTPDANLLCIKVKHCARGFAHLTYCSQSRTGTS